jgi:acyl-CoA synthetase (AMP-forming)/AMP-acid ligase II
VFDLGAADEQIALVDADSGDTVSYRSLVDRVDSRAHDLANLAGSLVFLGSTTSVSTVVDALALSRIGATTALLDPTAPRSVLDAWVHAYQPDAAWGFDNFTLVPACGPANRRTEAVLLATSGSTGSPKFVRLSSRNIGANADQIARALQIGAPDVAVAHLPMFYSYGLSVVTSHLSMGATVILTNTSPVQSDFWDVLGRHGVTSLAGVPYSYELYRRVGLKSKDLPELRTLTQAGGRLPPDRITEFHDIMAERSGALWIMYGQTEATARIAVLPPDELPTAIGSVGYTVPGGTMSVADPDDNGVGELIYSGPNVMLGYSTSRADLTGGDVLSGILATGDVGRIDDHGRIWVSGRTKRIAKVFGTRVSLDDVEALIHGFGPIAAVDAGDSIAVFIETADGVEGLARQIERQLGFGPRAINVFPVDELPRTAVGKIDYSELRQRCTT